MIKASLSFFILAIFAYILGANNIAGVSVEIGKLLLIVFLVLATFSFLGSLFYGKTPKSLLSITIAFFMIAALSVASAYAEDAPKASATIGLFVEPSFTYDLGGSTTDYPSPFTKSDGDINGFGIGGRLGFHINDSFFAGADGRFSFPTFKEDSLAYDTNAKAINFAPVIGFQMPDVGLRVWASYILLASLNPDSKNGLDLNFKDGTGYRVGAGFRVTSISLNLEYQHIKYGSAELEQIGIFTPGSTFKNVNLVSNSWIVSVSSPIDL